MKLTVSTREDDDGTYYEAVTFDGSIEEFDAFSVYSESILGSKVVHAAETICAQTFADIPDE